MRRSSLSWLPSDASSWPCPPFSLEPLGPPQVRDMHEHSHIHSVVVFTCVFVLLEAALDGLLLPLDLRKPGK